MAEYVPSRVIAEWMQWDVGNTRTKLSRLRQKLRNDFVLEARTLSQLDRQRLHQMLSKAGFMQLAPTEMKRVAEPLHLANQPPEVV